MPKSDTLAVTIIPVGPATPVDTPGGGQVYIEYVNPKNDWAAAAMSLAARGKGGEDVRVLDVD